MPIITGARGISSVVGLGAAPHPDNNKTTNKILNLANNLNPHQS